MRLSILLFLATALSTKVFSQSIYSFKIDSIAGTQKIDFANFAGKKILIVNTSPVDSCSYQYNDLKLLQQAFKDSLVIIAIPSDDFNAAVTNTSVQNSYYDQSGVSKKFPVAAKLIVSGANINPLYQWLAGKSQNGVMDQAVKSSFQKYLIDKNGKLQGVFSKSIRPTSTFFIDLIRQL